MHGVALSLDPRIMLSQQECMRWRCEPKNTRLQDSLSESWQTVSCGTVGRNLIEEFDQQQICELWQCDEEARVSQESRGSDRECQGVDTDGPEDHKCWFMSFMHQGLAKKWMNSINLAGWMLRRSARSERRPSFKFQLLTLYNIAYLICT